MEQSPAQSPKSPKSARGEMAGHASTTRTVSQWGPVGSSPATALSRAPKPTTPTYQSFSPSSQILATNAPFLGSPGLDSESPECSLLDAEMGGEEMLEALPQLPVHGQKPQPVGRVSHHLPQDLLHEPLEVPGVLQHPPGLEKADDDYGKLISNELLSTGNAFFFFPEDDNFKEPWVEELLETPSSNPRQRDRLKRLWCHLFLDPVMLSPGFEMAKKIIGARGGNTKSIHEATGAKVRLRGRGTGHLEIKSGEEAPNLMLAITSPEGEQESFAMAVKLGVQLLRSVAQRFEAFCRHNKMDCPARLYWIGELSLAGLECLKDAEFIKAMELDLPASISWRSTAVLGAPWGHRPDPAKAYATANPKKAFQMARAAKSTKSKYQNRERIEDLL